MKKILILLSVISVIFYLVNHNGNTSKTCMDDIKYCPCVDNNWCPDD